MTENDNESESDSDVPVAEDDEVVVCPVCDSPAIKDISSGVSELDYHCTDCGAEFDPSSETVNVE